MMRSAGLPPEIPQGDVVYAIGDIHGRLDLLEICLGALGEAAMLAGRWRRRMVAVFLGDYVDRGPDSRGVIERLIAFRQAGLCETIFLRGNHEQVILDVIDGGDDGVRWLKHGGMETLTSYSPAAPSLELQQTAALRAVAQNIIPSSHIEFLRSTGLMAQIGDYIFVHAGLRPDRLLEEQAAEDLLWLRYYDDVTPVHGCTVVHGHSANSVPVCGRYRIGIDTEAHASGVLSMVRLEGNRREFLNMSLSEGGASGVSVWPATDSAYRSPRRGRDHAAPDKDRTPPDKVGESDRDGGGRRPMPSALSRTLLAAGATFSRVLLGRGQAPPMQPAGIESRPPSQSSLRAACDDRSRAPVAPSRRNQSV